MIIITLFRAVTSEVFGLPNRPRVEVPVAYGPLVTEQKRAENSIRLYSDLEPHRQHYLQRIDYE